MKNCDSPPVLAGLRGYNAPENCVCGLFIELLYQNYGEIYADCLLRLLIALI